MERGKAFQNALADAGLAALTYPVEAGGAGLDAEHQKVFDEESADYEMPSRQFMVGIGICAPTLLEHGTDEQRRTYLPALLRADAIWCQLFSEPGAGSDVASLQTRAERDGDEWVVNGQKVWTSGAHYADYGLLVARTNRDVPKHRGISMFIVDMHSPGITSRPLRQIDGHAHFNEVFLDDVRLPVDAVVGEVDDGWRVTLAMLANERVAIGAGGSSQSLTSDGYGSVLRLAACRGCTDDPLVRQELVELYVLERILALLGMRIREALVSGRAPGPEGSVAKLAATVLGKQSASLGMALAGPGGLAWSERRAGRRRPGDGVPVRADARHRRRHHRDPEEHHRRARARAAEGPRGRQGRAVPRPPGRHAEVATLRPWCPIDQRTPPRCAATSVVRHAY